MLPSPPDTGSRCGGTPYHRTSFHTMIGPQSVSATCSINSRKVTESPGVEVEMAAKPQVGFLGCARMRARPAGPAQSSVLHDSARRGPTKEAHRRALNRSDGLLRSVAGQGHARVLRVTLPRGASDQRKRAEAGIPRSPTPGGDSSGEGSGDPYGDRSGETRPAEKWQQSAQKGHSELRPAIARQGRPEGLNRPRRGRDPAPGRVRPMPSPGGKYHPARRRPASRSFIPGRRRRPARDGSTSPSGRGCSTLTPGRAGWSR